MESRARLCAWLAGRSTGYQASGLFTASAYTKVQLGVSATLISLRVEKLRARPSFLLPFT